jgi:uncharacterized protein (TIGR02996 family)
VTTDDAFSAAIFERPDDHTTGLVYSDWLVERGEHERAEAIRLRSVLAGLDADDLRRPALEARCQALLAAHRDDWAVPCGVPMPWACAVELFRRRLAETVAWCRGRDVASLRTPDLEPPTLLSRHVPSGQGLSWQTPTTAERQAAVNDLANRRAVLLGDPATAGGLGGGRLVLFDPDGTLSDEAAVPASEGFFDGDNVPAWDTRPDAVGGRAGRPVRRRPAAARRRPGPCRGRQPRPLRRRCHRPRRVAASARGRAGR